MAEKLFSGKISLTPFLHYPFCVDKETLSCVTNEIAGKHYAHLKIKLMEAAFYSYNSGWYTIDSCKKIRL